MMIRTVIPNTLIAVVQVEERTRVCLARSSLEEAPESIGERREVPIYG
jgi:hypothetical protein